MSEIYFITVFKTMENNLGYNFFWCAWQLLYHRRNSSLTFCGPNCSCEFQQAGPNSFCQKLTNILFQINFTERLIRVNAVTNVFVYLNSKN